MHSFHSRATEIVGWEEDEPEILFGINNEGSMTRTLVIVLTMAATTTMASWHRLLSDEVEEEEHLDDFDECEEACEVCEERHCKNLWLETPRGRHLTIAELTYTQNVCIVLLIALLTVFTALYKAAKELGEKYELHHVEEIPYDKVEAPAHWVPTNQCQIAKKIRDEGAPAAPEQELEAPVVSEAAKVHSTSVHAVMHRAFAFYATVAGHVDEKASPAHETLVKIINHQPSEHYYQKLLQSLNAELMGLGWIAIFIWIAEQAGFFKAASVGKSGRWGPQRPEEAKITFENIHFAVFAGVLVHFLFLFLALYAATRRFDCFMSHELEAAQKKRPLQRKPSGIIDHSCTSKFAKESPDFFPELRTAMIKWISVNVDQNFDKWHIATPKLTKPLFDSVGDDFPVAVYLRLSLDNLVEHLIDVQHSSWLAILLVYAIEGILARLAEIDVPAISLGVATLLNLTIAAIILLSRRKLMTFCHDPDKTGHTGTREHWAFKQLPRFLQASTLYIVIQFARFIVDTIVDPKTQIQRYRGNQSYTGWIFLQIANLLIHFVLNQFVFAEVSILLSTPPVIGAKSIDLLAEIALLYNNILSKLYNDDSQT